MNIPKEALEHGNEPATEAFIEAALKDVEEYVDYIEGKFYVKLISDREGLIRAKDEWKSMTYAQVAFMASYWKKGLDDRYDQ